MSGISNSQLKGIEAPNSSFFPQKLQIAEKRIPWDIIIAGECPTLSISGNWKWIKNMCL